MKIDPQHIKSEILLYANKRNAFFLFLAAVATFLAYLPVKAFYKTPMGGYYTHIALVPLVSLYLLWLKRKDIAQHQALAPVLGIPFMLAGLVFYFVSRALGNDFDANDATAMATFSVFVFANGAFMLAYGWKAYRIALFPLLFLVFIIPMPTDVMEYFIDFLRIGSTEITNLLLTVSGAPFVRHDFVFNLPNVSVEVAKQCSGIRSAMAIFITAVLAGYMFLQTTWKIIVLIVCAVFIAMFKNAIRIVSLTLLGNYVDPRILQSDLHREGGIPFFIVALVLMAPILFFLMRSEKKKAPGEQ